MHSSTITAVSIDQEVGMNLFSSIEGLRQEDMTTSLLRHLIISSPEIKTAFVRFLSDHSNKGPLISESFFSCMTEFPTMSEDAGDGRVDMLLTLDGAVIGLENKLYAEFQTDQPQKYRHQIETIAESQQESFGQNVDWQIFTICPRSRKKEVLDRVGNSRDYPVICWEDLIHRLEKVRDTIIDSPSKILLDEYLKYLDDLLGFLPEYPQTYVHTRSDFAQKGTPLQKYFMQRVWRFLPEAGKRLSQGDTYVGYYFNTESSKAEGWCGFVSSTRLKTESGDSLNRDTNAELVLSTSWVPPQYEDSPEKYGLIPVQIQSENWLNNNQPVHAWIMNFDEKWAKADKWFECLEPLHSSSGI